MHVLMLPQCSSCSSPVAGRSRLRGDRSDLDYSSRVRDAAGETTAIARSMYQKTYDIRSKGGPDLCLSSDRMPPPKRG
jgi:hypothetical protein